jgi:hypothetical protein
MLELEEDFKKVEFPLRLHPDGADWLYCKECQCGIEDGEDGRHLGDECPYCVPPVDTQPKRA